MDHLSPLSFPGTLNQAGRSGSGINVEMIVAGDSIRITMANETLGVWPTSRITFEHAYPGVFNLNVDGEPWVFKTRHPSSLIAALPRKAVSPGKPRSVVKAVPQPSVRRRMVVIWSWIRPVKPSSLFGLLLVLVAVFTVGYSIGRSPSWGSALLVGVVIAGATFGAFARDSSGRPRHDRSVAPQWLVSRVQRRSSGAAKDHHVGPEITAKRLAEALERIAAPVPSPQTDSNPAGPLRFRQGAPNPDRSPRTDTRGDRGGTENASAAVIFLDAHGRVIRRSEAEGRPEEENVHGSASGVPSFGLGKEPGTPATGHRPETPSAPNVTPDAALATDTRSDDLERIHGIGPVYAEALASLGFGSYAAIASLGDEDVRQIETLVGPIRSRMERHKWREHAQALLVAEQRSGEDPPTTSRRQHAE